jgi:hypothetical protein
LYFIACGQDRTAAVKYDATLGFLWFESLSLLLPDGGIVLAFYGLQIETSQDHGQQCDNQKGEEKNCYSEAFQFYISLFSKETLVILFVIIDRLEDGSGVYHCLEL